MHGMNTNMTKINMYDKEAVDEIVGLRGLHSSDNSEPDER
jgi:hypothetical protein